MVNNPRVTEVNCTSLSIFLQNFIEVKVVNRWLLFLLLGIRLLLIAQILFLGSHLREVFGCLVKTGREVFKIKLVHP
jgi:hypothetical protein